MKKQSKRIIIIAILAIIPLLSFGNLILSSNDFIIAINTNDFMRSFSRMNKPVIEGVELLLDGDPSTKYVNSGGGGWDALYCGFLVTPANGSSTIKSFMLTTPNDNAYRDPTTWDLYGTTDSITSTNNSNGTEENWILIESGTVTLPTNRFTEGPIVPVSNFTAYTSYKMIFPNLGIGSDGKPYDNVFQSAGVAFYSVTDGSGADILSISDAILAVQTAPASKYNPGQEPFNLLDNNVDTKHLNYGRENSGFIVTPNYGSSVVLAFEIWTANDRPERDPTNWVLYGTTDAIISKDNGQGLAENWTLIDEGYINLPEERGTNSGLVIVNNTIPYTSYKMIFPKLKNPEAANSMQISRIQFDSLPEPTVLLLLSLGSFVLLRRKG